MVVHSPDVVITDLLIAVLCAYFVFQIATQSSTHADLRYLFTGLFAVTGLASYYIWRLFIFFALPQRFRSPLIVLLFIMLTAYFTVVLIGLKGFKVAIAAYLPPAILLTLTFLYKWLARKDARYFLGLSGLILTLAAAAVQALKISPHDQYFNHNALYHVIQAVGLYLIFKFAQRIISWQQ